MTLRSDLPTQRDLRRHGLALGVASLLVGGTVAAMPFASQPAPVFTGLVPAFLGAAILATVVTSHLVLAQFDVSGRPSLLALASAFGFAALAMLAYLLAAPGLFSEAGVPGTDAGLSRTFFLIWHAGFPALVLAHVAIDRRVRVTVPRAHRRLVAAVAFAVTTLAVGAVYAIAARLPTALLAALLFHRFAAPAVWLFDLAALAVLLRAARRSHPVDLWLCVAVLALTLDMGLTIVAEERYTLGWYVARGNALLASGVLLAVCLAEVHRLYARAATMAAEFGKLAYRDGLTGLFNKRAFSESLSREWAIAVRERRPISLVICDLDFFKQYNDGYGHQAGDECLRAISRVVAGAAGRPADLAARFGGEELVVLLPETDVLGAWEVGERIRRGIERLGIPHASSGVAPVVTVSVGVAARTPSAGDTAETLVRAADVALYDAKNRGRNRVAPSRLRLALDPSSRPRSASRAVALSAPAASAPSSALASSALASTPAHTPGR